MRRRRATLTLIAALAGVAVFASASPGQQTVAPGHELLQTVVGTQFSIPCPEGGSQRVSLRGVPLGSFDFDGAGSHDVGATDTILRRRQEAVADAEGTATVDVEIVALSLASRAPVELCGNPEQEIFVTLNQELTAALADRGRRTIHFDPMTFETAAQEPGGPNPRLHYWIDVSGSVSGDLGSFEKRFVITNQPRWRHQGPTGALAIDGVNHLLNGVDESADFFAIDTVVEDDGGNNWHQTRTTAPPVRVPALAAWGALLLAALLLGSMTWALRHRPAGTPDRGTPDRGAPDRGER